MKKISALVWIASGAMSGFLLACSSGTETGMTQVMDMSVQSFTVGGSVTSLTGSGLVLSLNGTEDLPISAFGPFVFGTKVATGAQYSVTVKSTPPAQACTVMSGSGTMGTANVTNVAVACNTSAYKVGGSVTGLTGSLVLQNNAGDDVTVGADGAFEFATPVAISSLLVIMTTGVKGLNFLISAKVSSPVIPGIFSSKNTISKLSFSTN